MFPWLRSFRFDGFVLAFQALVHAELEPRFIVICLFVRGYARMYVTMEYNNLGICGSHIQEFFYIFIRQRV